MSGCVIIGLPEGIAPDTPADVVLGKGWKMKDLTQRRSILVTGSAGFVGRHLCAALADRGDRVTHVDPVSQQPDDEFYFPLTFDDWLCEASAQAKYDVAVHLAANIVNVDDRVKMGVHAFDDLTIDLRFCQWAQATKPKHIVLMSSCATDGVVDPYSQIKRNLEAMAQALVRKGLSVTVLRPFSGYGGDQSLEYPFPAILRRALNKENPLNVWGGMQIRDWLYIDDLVDAVTYAIDSKFPINATPIDIGTGIGHTFFTLAHEIAEAVGYAPRIDGLFNKEISTMKRIANTDLARSFGWSARTPLAQGVWRACDVMQKEMSRGM